MFRITKIVTGKTSRVAALLGAFFFTTACVGCGDAAPEKPEKTKEEMRQEHIDQMRSEQGQG